VFVLSSDFRTKANTAMDMDESTSSPRKEFAHHRAQSLEKLSKPLEMSFEKVYTWYNTDVVSNPFFWGSGGYDISRIKQVKQKTASYKSIKKAQHR
jgi:hypothetical protein